MAKVQSIHAVADTSSANRYSTSYMSIRAHVHFNVPEGRESGRRSPTVTLERAYNVNEMEARAAAEQWREANPEMDIRARYTIEL